MSLNGKQLEKALPRGFTNDQGITLVETLIGLSILLIALIPTYRISSAALHISSSIRDDVIAGNLAQEGVEVIGAIRDANWFNNLAFDAGLTNCTAGCRVQWKSSAVLGLNGNPVLTVHPTMGTYYYKDVEGDLGGTDTAFSRKITITNISSNQMKIVSDVTWTDRLRERSITLESHLFNWR